MFVITNTLIETISQLHSFIVQTSKIQRLELCYSSIQLDAKEPQLHPGIKDVGSRPTIFLIKRSKNIFKIYPNLT